MPVKMTAVDTTGEMFSSNATTSELTPSTTSDTTLPANISQCDISGELRQFLSRISSQPHSVRVADVQLTAGALRLMHVLPVSRQAVLEHLDSVLNAATGNFFTRVEKGDDVSDSPDLPDVCLVSDIHQFLQQLINSAPAVWVPLLVPWALNSLGRLSASYASRSVSARSSDLADALRLWSTCPSTGRLLQLVHTCVAADADSCIRPLLDNSLRFSPHFDWVVANVGSCFPRTIISRMLHFGVSEFDEHSSRNTDELSSKLRSIIQIVDYLAGRHSDEIDQALVDTLNSVFTDSSDSGAAARTTNNRLAAIPFLLQLCNMSTHLLNSFTCVALNKVRDDQFDLLANQLPPVIPRYFASPASLLTLLARLVLRCGASGALSVVNLLFRLSAPTAPVSPPVRHASICVLERVLCEIEQLVHVGGNTVSRGRTARVSAVNPSPYGPDNPASRIPLLGAVCSVIAGGSGGATTRGPTPCGVPTITVSADDPASGARWIRLVAAVVARSGPVIAQLALSRQLQLRMPQADCTVFGSGSDSSRLLDQLLHMVSALEVVAGDVLASGFWHALTTTTTTSAADGRDASSNVRVRVLTAALAMVRWESARCFNSAVKHEKCTGVFTSFHRPQSRLSTELVSDRRLLSQLATQLLAEPAAADVAAQLLWQLQLPESLSASCRVWLAHCCVWYLFVCLRRLMASPTIMKHSTSAVFDSHLLTLVYRAQQLLARLCTHPVCLPVVIRQLVHTALKFFVASTSSSPSSSSPVSGEDDGREARGDTALLEANRRAAASAICASLSHTSVLRAGVIGRGRRLAPLPTQRRRGPADLETQTAAHDLSAARAGVLCQVLSDSVAVCVEAAPAAEDVGRMLALLLVELVSPDIMFNGLPWPDEEFAKVTIERDLQIRRTFDNCELLWQLLELVARRPPALCYCSVLLRALTITVINHWSNTQELKAASCPVSLHVTTRLLHIMCTGRLLSPPFLLYSDVIQHISSYEVMLLMTEVWSFMRDTVPSPALFTSLTSSYTSSTCRPSSLPQVHRPFSHAECRISRSLILIVQRNVAALGHLWPQIYRWLPHQ